VNRDPWADYSFTLDTSYWAWKPRDFDRLTPLGGMISRVRNRINGDVYGILSAQEVADDFTLRDYWTSTVQPAKETPGFLLQRLKIYRSNVLEITRNSRAEAFAVHEALKHVIRDQDWRRFNGLAPDPVPPQGFSPGALHVLAAKGLAGDERLIEAEVRARWKYRTVAPSSAASPQPDTEGLVADCIGNVCPHCQGSYEFLRREVGRHWNCPHCGARVVLRPEATADASGRTRTPTVVTARDHKLMVRLSRLNFYCLALALTAVGLSGFASEGRFDKVILLSGSVVCLFSAWLSLRRVTLFDTSERVSPHQMLFHFVASLFFYYVLLYKGLWSFVELRRGFSTAVVIQGVLYIAIGFYANGRWHHILNASFSILDCRRDEVA
jgi:DNA-directed RNA polymerase subunit RPC12/RpoP